MFVKEYYYGQSIIQCFRGHYLTWKIIIPVIASASGEFNDFVYFKIHKTP